MKYVVARLDEYGRDMVYRFYITDSLQSAPKGMCMVNSFHDILYKPSITTSENAEDVVVNIMKNAGLSFKG